MNENVDRREFLEAAIVAGVALPLSTVLPGKTAHARRLVEQAIRQYERAWESSSDTGWEVAIAAFTNVIKIDPANQLAFVYRGKAHYWSGDYKRAAADFSQAMQADPVDEEGLDWSSSYTAIRVFEEKMGDRSAALRHWLRMAVRKAAKATSIGKSAITAPTLDP